MIIGGILGIVVGEPMMQLGFIGDIWMCCIKMVIVPMILAAIISGIVSQKDVASLGRIAGMILLYYCVTTIFACMVGIGTTTLLKPGVWGSLSGMQGQEVFPKLSVVAGYIYAPMNRIASQPLLIIS